jgi:hypothetical protein
MEDMDGSREDHILEFFDRTEPEVFPIRREEIRHMNWTYGQEHSPFDVEYGPLSDDEEFEDLEFSI